MEVYLKLSMVLMRKPLMQFGHLQAVTGPHLKIPFTCRRICALMKFPPPQLVKSTLNCRRLPSTASELFF
jgi:hypothetical protein